MRVDEGWGGLSSLEPEMAQGSCQHQFGIYFGIDVAPLHSPKVTVKEGWGGGAGRGQQRDRTLCKKLFPCHLGAPSPLNRQPRGLQALSLECLSGEWGGRASESWESTQMDLLALSAGSPELLTVFLQVSSSVLLLEALLSPRLALGRYNSIKLNQTYNVCTSSQTKQIHSTHMPHTKIPYHTLTVHTQTQYTNM